MTVTYSYDAHWHECTFTFPSLTNGKGERNFRCPMSPTVTWNEFAPFAEAAVGMLTSESADSINEKIEILKSNQRFMDSESITFPIDDEDWDWYLGKHFDFTLDDKGTTKKRRGETRIDQWSKNSRFYRAAQEKGLIPKNAFIPLVHLSDGSKLRPSQRPPLGKLASEVSINSGKWNKHALVSRDLCLDEDEFLCRISASLSDAVQATANGCEEYLAKMKTAHDIGRDLISRINRQELELRIRTGNFYKDGVHVIDLKSKDGLSWFLAAANYFLAETDHLDSINLKALRKIEFFQKLNSSWYRIELIKIIRKTIGKYGIHTKNITENICRLLGHFSARDCAAMASILIIDQPRFPSTGLQAAALVNADGDTLIEIQLDEKIIRFSIEKPRADKYQSEALTSRSATIFKDILRCTENIRKKLRARNDLRANFLFLTVTRDGTGCPGNIDNIMHANGHTLYKEIAHHYQGLHFDKETFSLGALRVTQGIITYFQTGSLYEVSLRLGNQVQVVKSCYIPNWVQERRYIWMIRAFQAKLVLLATANKPWELVASDFLTEDELKLFVSKQLIKNNRPDAFSQHFRANFNNHKYTSTVLELVDKNLAFEISEQSLTALYSLVDHSIKNNHPKDLEIIDPVLSVSLNSMIQLKGLIAGIAEAKPSSEFDQQLASNIYQGSILELQLIHKKAIINAKEYIATGSLKKMEIAA